MEIEKERALNSNEQQNRTKENKQQIDSQNSNSWISGESNEYNTINMKI